MEIRNSIGTSVGFVEVVPEESLLEKEPTADPQPGPLKINADTITLSDEARQLLDSPIKMQTNTSEIQPINVSNTIKNATDKNVKSATMNVQFFDTTTEEEKIEILDYHRDYLQPKTFSISELMDDYIQDKTTPVINVSIEDKDTLLSSVIERNTEVNIQNEDNPMNQDNPSFVINIDSYI